MIEHAQLRTELLLGEKLALFQDVHIAVFGVGGVGCGAIEALARLGVGHFSLIDQDVYSLSNLNRQLYATQQTLGLWKVEVAKQRILSINPNADVQVFPQMYLPETATAFPFEKWDYIIDAIDNVTAKLDLIQKAQQLSIPIISAMGCGNRLDPGQLRVCDLYQTNYDPLAKIMRHECRKRGIRSLDVVCSLEAPLKPLRNLEAELSQKRKAIPGSSPFVPPMAGYLMAHHVMRAILKKHSLE